MFLIPQNVLEKLKCGECKELITSFPIYSKKNSENFCGKCKVNKEQRKNLFRNYLFEEIAQHLLIPCKYEDEGCKMTLRYGKKFEEHIENCEFGNKIMLNCPSLPSGKCGWKGSLDKLPDHYKDLHKDFFVAHPYVLKAYQNWIINDMKHLRKSSNKKFLMEAHGFLFLLSFKVCFQSDTLWVCVSFLGEPKLAPHFQAFVELGDQRNSIYIINVLHSSSVFDEKCALKLALHKNFKIIINLNAVKCLKCGTNFEKLPPNLKEYCCTNFEFASCAKTDTKKVFRRCINSERGCPSVDSIENALKHSVYLCKHDRSKICYECGKNIFKLNTNLFEHLKSHYSLCFKDTVVIEKSEIIMQESNAHWEVNNGSFLLTWGTALHEIVFDLFFERQEVVFFLHLISDFPAEIEEKLLIQFTFINKLTGERFSKLLERRRIDEAKRLPLEDMVHGWFIELAINTLLNRAVYKIHLSLLNALEFK